MKAKFGSLVLIFFFLASGYFLPPYMTPYMTQGWAYSGIVQALPGTAKFIRELAHIGETKGSKYVMEALEYGAKGLPLAKKAQYIQDNLLKVLVAQNRISKTQADEWARNLGKVPGFEKALNKMAGLSDKKTIGHGFELETANALHRSGYRIVEIGKPFSDGLKHGKSDIDVIARKGSRTYVFELKNYKVNNLDILNPPNDVKPVEVVLNDMETLKAFRKENPEAIPIFIFRNKPSNDTSLNWLIANGKKNNIRVLFGEPSVVVKYLDLM